MQINNLMNLLIIYLSIQVYEKSIWKPDAKAWHFSNLYMQYKKRLIA